MGTHEPHRLSPRELQVIRLVSEGQTDKEIAAALKIGEGTVSNYVGRVLLKLKARTRAHAVAILGGFLH